MRITLSLSLSLSLSLCIEIKEIDQPARLEFSMMDLSCTISLRISAESEPSGCGKDGAQRFSPR